MADEREATAVTSDTESSEKRTREQLKKASISKTVGDAQATDKEFVADADTAGPSGDRDGEEGVDEVEQGDTGHETAERPTREVVNAGARHHTRKRSRDSTAEEDELNNGQRKSGERVRGDEASATSASNGAPKAPDSSERPRTPEQTGEKRGEALVEAMTSPKTKRSRLQSERAQSAATTSARPAEEATTSTTIPPTSGFSNTSAASPFASLAGSTSPLSSMPQTSSSAFASSAFGSLSGSSTSGFGAIGKTSGGFGTGGSFATSSTATKTDEASKTASGSAFGASLGQQSPFSSTGSTLGSGGSAFGSAASGFGRIGQGSAFGGSGFSSLGGAGGLASFASGKASASLAKSSKPVKTFGAPAVGTDDDEEGAEDEGTGEDDDGFKSPLSQESDKQDERFYAQDLETGEEDEKTEYSCRAKLYNFVANEEGKKEWKERGLGVVRLNVQKADVEAQSDGESHHAKARLLMRAEGSYRVILNTPVKKELKFGAPSGGPPQGGYLYFMGAVDGKKGLEMLQLKVRQLFATELYEKIIELQESM